MFAVLVGHFFDKLGAMRDLCRRNHLLVRRFRSAVVAVSDIAFYVAAEKHRPLRNVTEFVVKRLYFIILYVYAVYEYFALGCVKKSGDEIDNGAFSATRAADKRYRFAAVGFKADVFKHAFFRVGILETDVFKLYDAH